MKTLTVFTPSYNRAYTLHKCYESLLRQTSKDFTWVIIDDGSSDNTKELVDSWINENKLEINYIYYKYQNKLTPLIHLETYHLLLFHLYKHLMPLFRLSHFFYFYSRN